MANELKEQITDRSRWLRLLYIILYVAIFQIVEIVVGLTIVVQFVSFLFTGRTLERLRGLGESLGTYMRQMVLYVTFASTERPYPFSPWPRPGAAAGTAPAPQWDEPRPESDLGPDE